MSEMRVDIHVRISMERDAYERFSAIVAFKGEKKADGIAQAIEEYVKKYDKVLKRG